MGIPIMRARAMMPEAGGALLALADQWTPPRLPVGGSNVAHSRRCGIPPSGDQKVRWPTATSRRSVMGASPSESFDERQTPFVSEHTVEHGERLDFGPIGE